MGNDLRSATDVLTGPGQVVEVRAITGRGIHSGYFNDYDELVNRVAALDANPEVRGIYITLNTVNPALLARRTNRIAKLGPKEATTADADILRRRWFPVDIDPVRPGGVSSTDEEHSRALAMADGIAGWLTELGFPEPVKGDSGNGAHLLYRIDLPNDDEGTQLVKRGLAVLDAIFSDKTVTVDTANFNAGRIWKLYGTVSRKGDSTQDRPHRRSRIISAPEKIQTVNKELLVKLGEAFPSEVRAENLARTGNGKKIDLGCWLADHEIAVLSRKPWNGGTLFVLDQCPFSSDHKDGAYAIQSGSGAIFAGCHHNSCGGGTQRWKELREKYEPAAKRKKSPEERLNNGKKERARAKAAEANTPAVEEFRETGEHSKEDRLKAIEVLTHGNPRSFILDAYSRVHVGDELVAECYLVSFLSSSVLNSRGLHVCPTGDSGKGKSDSARGFLQMIPARYRVSGSITSKALFYHEIPEGAVIIFDDIEMGDDLREVLKNATSDFHSPLRHLSLTKNREPVTLNLPPRCVWWILSVESPGDDQVLNRMLNPWIDDSETQDKLVKERVFERAMHSAAEVMADTATAICCALLNEIRTHSFHVRIPFASRIMIDNFRNRRNPIMLLDMIRSFAVLNFLQRKERVLPDGSIEIDADERDFSAAASLFTRLDTTGGGQTSKLLKSEKMLLDTVIAMKTEEFTIGQLQQWMGFSFQHIFRILHGRPDRDRNTTGGLLAKCPALGVIDTTVSEDDGTTMKRRRANHYTFDYEQFRRWNIGGRVWLLPDPSVGGEDNLPTGPISKANGLTNGLVTNPDRNASSFNPGHDTDNTIKNSTKLTHISKNVPPSCSGLNSHEQDPARLRDPGKWVNENAITGNCGDNPEILSQQENPVNPPVNPPESPAGKREMKAAKQTAPGSSGPVPLPGVLDFRDFERVKVPMSRCCVCQRGAAVFWNEKERTGLCEGCYRRLVRERKEG